MKKVKNKKLNILLLIISIGIFCVGLLFIYIGTVKIPDFKSFEERKMSSSTKIYDQTGKIVLYDIHKDIKRAVVPFSDMGINIKNATVAIEDSSFYQHSGIRIQSFIRAILKNFLTGNFSQGGSTITQQVVKNTLLTPEKTIGRKIKEWVLSIKIEKVMSKEDILGIYLNEAPYGGNVYGIAEASRMFFNKEPFNLSIAEAAYLAAIPNAPTFYSPYGKNKERLDQRKNLVLEKMKDLGFIGALDYENALKETVKFLPQEPTGIKAPHFVFFIKEYLEEKYGQDAVENDGLKVTSTLDYDLQKKAEEIVLKQAKDNEIKYKGKNAALVSIDPKTGEVLAMVGSRNYFDKEIDGNFNVATAKRQPGSSFKPFIYVDAFTKGYTPETVLFDLPTEFNSSCSPYGKAAPGNNQKNCYMPDDYDGKFRGPISLRNALAQSINVPAVKLLYLVGINDSIKTARDLGIKTLTNADQYGLTLVIGGGEVSLLDMTSAYSVFANSGVRHPYTGILKIEDNQGNILEEYTPGEGSTVLPKNSVLTLSDILSDNKARVPTFGEHSVLEIPGASVAVKTGTTNNDRDAWTIGYTPSIVTGVWVGNNENTPMLKGGAALAGPIWNQFMVEALKKYPAEDFEKPFAENNYNLLKPVFRGYWQGGTSFFIDKISGKLATEFTPKETKEEKVITNPHSILYWIIKDNPQGEAPTDPNSDSQFTNWEIPIQDWWGKNKHKYNIITEAGKPLDFDNVHIEANKPVIVINNIDENNNYTPDTKIDIGLNIQGVYPIKKADFFINNNYIGSKENSPFNFSFTLSDFDFIKDINELKVIVYDTAYNSNQTTKTFFVKFD